MALATQADVQDDLGRDLTATEASRVAALLARADAVVLGYLGCAEEPDPVPAALTASVAAIVARALSAAAPIGAQSVRVDDASVSYYAGAESGGLWLTPTDKLALRPYRCGGGLTSVQLVGERYTIEAS